jgi:hypothetical protein
MCTSEEGSLPAQIMASGLSLDKRHRKLPKTLLIRKVKLSREGLSSGLGKKAELSTIFRGSTRVGRNSHEDWNRACVLGSIREGVQPGA